eukprot:TRINITY_DN16067_c0_g1_i1.p1 TRINITY_DN16067_c0_g1~~TRINITY_DN16067_c0_g1_i1.p1  ORF type:complete len:528 (+),score=123.05 TRINITY_DN16067_c0_g1_i1:73-1584(+)
MGTSEIALEKVQALLKVDTGSGSLHDHLLRIVRKLSEDKPGDALAQLETLSRHLKKSTFRGESAPEESKPVSVDEACEELRRRWCGESVSLVRPPSDPTAAPKVLAAVQNFMEDSAMFEWAGVGFGKQESFHVAMSLRKLAADTPSLDSLRLWGKILGTGGDYYVAEGVLQAPPPPPLSAPPQPTPPFVLPGTPEYDVEPRGQGANACAYWVSKGGSAPWVRLPAARASHISAARRMQKLMSGDLASAVLSSPWFPGEERHLLRAQIARISASTVLAVKGWYEVDEETEQKNKIKLAEDPAGSFPGQDELGTQAGWVHASPYLLQTGRSVWPDLDAIGAADPPVLPEKELNDLMQARDEKDSEKPILESIEADLEERKPDDSEAEGSIAWQIKIHGDKGLYNGGEVSHRVTSVRSLIWPGAVAVAQGKRFANLYVGYGLKCGTLVPGDKLSKLPLPLRGTCPFAPLEPEEIMEEPDDLEEYPEPNPQDKDAESDQGDIDADEE